MNTWLAKNDIENIWYQQDRRLRACLVAHSGHGIIFLDSTDSDEEQRFSLAHELAHYLLDYWKPRKNAVQRLGSTVLEVFDGVRPPWPEERIDAILTGIQLGFHVHLMERNSEGRIAVAAISTAESRADRLAYELLAPSDTVFDSLERHGTNKPRDAVCALLQTDFGLPEIQARQYASLLLPEVKPPDNFLLRLGL
jgi:Zn-dependent peptidase ImmA (M78 family)